MDKVTQKQYVSDLIKEDYKRWKNERILIGCGTGQGKTYFSLSVYAKYLESQGKYLMYLCNRRALKNQIEKNIKEIGLSNVLVFTYQGLTKMIQREKPVLDCAAYICDEAHYFISDASFNFYTDIPYDYLMGKTGATVVYMTATYRAIFRRLNKDIKAKKQQEPKTYLLPPDYSYVDKIFWFDGKDVQRLIDSILYEHPQDKIIYFCNSITKMEYLYKQYAAQKDGEEDNPLLKHMRFMCSQSSKSDFVKEHCKEKVLVRSKTTDGYTFDGKVLVITKVIDNGIDIKDTRVKHIICDIFDIDSAIQCLGRKRTLGENDTCNFYIRNYKNNEVTMFLRKINKEIEVPELFLKDKNEWRKQYGNNRTYINPTIFYDRIGKDWKLNKMRYQKLISDRRLFTSMVKKITSYREQITRYMGEDICKKYEFIEQKKRTKKELDELELYLKNHVGELLDKKKQEELISLCDVRDKRGRLKVGIGAINGYLNVDKNYPYILKAEQRRVAGKRSTFWIIHPKCK